MGKNRTKSLEKQTEIIFPGSRGSKGSKMGQKGHFEILIEIKL